MSSMNMEMNSNLISDLQEEKACKKTALMEFQKGEKEPCAETVTVCGIVMPVIRKNS